MNDPASLHNLQDILEPAAVSFWPPAPGIALLMALILIWICVGLGLWLARRFRNRYRRAALRELADIRRSRDHETGSHTVIRIADLLKRVALTAFPRDRVASLSGSEWLEFLAETMGGRSFSESSGKLLSIWCYRQAGKARPVPEAQLDELLLQAEAWISRHNSDLPRQQTTSPPGQRQ